LGGKRIRERLCSLAINDWLGEDKSAITPAVAVFSLLSELDRHCIIFRNKKRRKAHSMKKVATMYLISLTMLLASRDAFAQAFGEYGRAVGSVPRGGSVGAGPRAPGGGTQGRIGGGGVGDVGGRGLPSRLVVAAKDAGLFPRQDEESERIVGLFEGESLVPLVQSEGGSQWFMVKTQKGLVGWVKSADVKQEAQKK
jgi:hypothetical protein